MHEFFEINARDFEMRAYIGYLRCMRFRHKSVARMQPSLFRHNRPQTDLGARYNERISDWRPFESLLLTDKCLKMFDLQNRSDKPQFVRARRREQ